MKNELELRLEVIDFIKENFPVPSYMSFTKEAVRFIDQFITPLHDEIEELKCQLPSKSGKP